LVLPEKALLSKEMHLNAGGTDFKNENFKYD